MVPYVIARIVDRDGEVLEDNWPSPRDAIRADTAYIMVSLMRGVVQRGTGVGALQLGWPVGGKTGTVDDYTDAWFVGFDAEITVGVWVGYDEKKTLGTGEQGARVALPIWRDFMQAYIDARVTQGAPEGFVPPDNIVFTSVDPLTGEVTEPWAHGAIQEARSSPGRNQVPPSVGNGSQPLPDTVDCVPPHTIAGHHPRPWLCSGAA